MSPIRLFDSVRENAIALADLHKLSFPDPWDPQSIARLAGGPGFALLHGTLARLDGFVLVRVAADEGEILTIASHPQKRGTGIGRALMLAAGTEAQARGATSLFLEVDATNAPARALYARVGFTKAGERKGYYRIPGRPPSDALILNATLPLRAASD